MCYDVKTKLEAQLKRARHYFDEEAIKQIEKELAPYLKDEETFRASGFEHPHVLVYTNEDKYKPQAAVWGLIPSWVKNSEQQMKLWNSTINARGETIFEKPSFKASANKKRCILVVDGFYEHHHFKGKPYPFFIQNKNREPITLGGLWEEWVNKDTGEIIKSFTIVTTKANELMTKIHNNPKLPEARMPLILNDEEIETWLGNDIDKVKSLLRPNTDIFLEAYTVQKIRGKDSLGNTPQAVERYDYEELMGLFGLNL